MEGVDLAIPAEVDVPQLMGSEVLLRARVCAAEEEVCESDCVLSFSAAKIEECSSLIGHRGISSATESSSHIRKTNTELHRGSSLLPSLETEDSSKGLDLGMIDGSIASISGCEEKQIQRKVGKVQRNSNGPFKKLRMLQGDNSLLQAEADDTKTELDKLGSHLVKCSNADKSLGVKQRNTINGRRADRRNSKVPVKAKYDMFLLKAGLPTFSPASGGSNVLGMHGPKPDLQDATKLIDDISLDELLDGSYKCPKLSKDIGNKAANVNESFIYPVMKACSILRLQRLHQDKQLEDSDVLVDKKIPSSPSPSNGEANSPDGDESINPAVDLCTCTKDQETCPKAKNPTEINDCCSYKPRDVLERLVLPPPRDLESLLQDAVKPVASVKLVDSRSSKPLSSRASLPPFPWSHSFNGHHKSNNDATKTSNRSSCNGRWVRIRTAASFMEGGDAAGFVDLDPLSYDDSLVPPGKLKYRLPEIARSLSTAVDQHCTRHNLFSSTSTAPQPPPALHSPREMDAAKTLCAMATHSLKINSNGLLKWQKQPLQKTTKARKSKSNEEEFPKPMSETIHNHEVRCTEHGSSAKKPKHSVVEKRQDFGHIQAVIGLSSVSAPRSSKPPPIKLCRDSAAEARQSNGNFQKPLFMTPPPRVLDRSTHHNPHKVRKVSPMDWNRTRS